MKKKLLGWAMMLWPLIGALMAVYYSAPPGHGAERLLVVVLGLGGTALGIGAFLSIVIGTCIVVGDE